ncbi:hypothetical protein DPMN_042378 [Dreissena polymorpha]|uniref:Uncharacterized protein n=1 Tax=Dreissena polymorpha TaxID=45954 RepID=A0A9D4HUQ0_DREPO|nr:hypothetical protein DPMN_042378 [Dreissena polymorpha]
MQQRNGSIEGQDQVTPHCVQNLQVLYGDEVDSASSDHVTMEGLEHSSMLEPGGTQKKATANNNREEQIKWPASCQKKELHLYEDVDCPCREGGPKTCSDVNSHAQHRTEQNCCVQQKKGVWTMLIFNRRQHKIN